MGHAKLMVLVFACARRANKKTIGKKKHILFTMELEVWIVFATGSLFVTLQSVLFIKNF